MIRTAVFTLVLTLLSQIAAAADLSLPAGARQLSNRVSLMDSYNLPTGAFADGAVPSRLFEGRMDRQTWRMDGSTVTTLQLMAPLRTQIEAAGFTLLFECWNETCGGFDFRFNTEIAPAPDMYVNVRNYRFLSATKGESEAISLLASVNRSGAYLQIIQVSPIDGATIHIAPDPSIVDAQRVAQAMRSASGSIERLEQDGHVVLGDLVFETGAARLGDGPFASLTLLAGYLADTPDLRIAVVGHTDSIGSLEANIALSKQRATAVRTRLIEAFKIDATRIQAEGMGYLAPVASNLSAQGRDANRRVEVIVLSQ